MFISYAPPTSSSLFWFYYSKLYISARASSSAKVTRTIIYLPINLFTELFT